MNEIYVKVNERGINKDKRNPTRIYNTVVKQYILHINIVIYSFFFNIYLV